MWQFLRHYGLIFFTILICAIGVCGVIFLGREFIPIALLLSFICLFYYRSSNH